jgi:CheY-like chemotaxis protein
MSARILLVEDNEQNRYLATYLLEQAGHRVIHAPNGKAALDLVRTEPLDLVLMDIQMPEMDGYEAAEHIRNVPGMENLPMVAVTSFAMPGDRERTMHRGFVGYIEKPISTETFITEIHTFLTAPPRQRP